MAAELLAAKRPAMAPHPCHEAGGDGAAAQGDDAPAGPSGAHQVSFDLQQQAPGGGQAGDPEGPSGARIASALTRIEEWRKGMPLLVRPSDTADCR